MLDLPSPVAPALSLIFVSKQFGATQALEDVNLDVGRGEVVALMGATARASLRSPKSPLG
jgi:ABC-type sugar transport system ATPase subunit